MAIDKEFNDKAWREIPAFISAAVKGDVPAMQKCLDEGMKVDAQDINGFTALMVAVRDGKTEAVDFLLQKGADVSARNCFGWTPLDIAAGQGNAELVEKLLSAGADATSANDCNACFMSRHGQPWKFGLNLGVTTLMVAAEGGFTGIVQTLINHKADVKGVDKWGRTALMRAAEKGHLDTLRLLLDKGADANVQSGDGWTALRTAAWNGHADIVGALLCVTDPKKAATGKEPGWSAIPEASSPAPGLDDVIVSAVGGAGNMDIIRILIDKGANVNARHQAGGESLLFMAALRGNTEAARFLLERGADIELRNKHGINALCAASNNDIKKLLKDAAEKKAPPVPPQAPTPLPPAA